MPIWAECLFSTDSTAAGLLGVVLLGVGDTVASVVGKSFGYLKWGPTNKTIEGTFAFIISSSFAYRSLYYLVPDIKPKSSIAVDIVVLASGKFGMLFCGAQ